MPKPVYKKKKKKTQPKRPKTFLGWVNYRVAYGCPCGAHIDLTWSHDNFGHYIYADCTNPTCWEVRSGALAKIVPQTPEEFFQALRDLMKGVE